MGKSKTKEHNDLSEKILRRVKNVLKLANNLCYKSTTYKSIFTPVKKEERRSHLVQSKQTMKMRSKTMVMTILLLVLWVSVPRARAADFIITKYGAKADGKTNIMTV